MIDKTLLFLNSSRDYFLTCLQLFQRKFSCQCYGGYEGVQCEEEKDLCSPQPCSNANKCTTERNDATKTATYKCSCITGWQGINCTEKIDQCKNETCSDRGSCKNYADSFICDCTGTGMFNRKHDKQGFANQKLAILKDPILLHPRTNNATVKNIVKHCFGNNLNSGFYQIG